MKNDDINIRDPFILYENDRYSMYGTRTENYGMRTGGFDVYVSSNPDCWSEPIQCIDSEKFNLNNGANWAPEVHKYNGQYTTMSF